MGSNLLCSLAYHPQIDEKKEVVNHSLGNMLSCLSGNKPRKWDLVLTQAEFAYNDSVNRFVGKIQFQIVYGRSLRGIVYLVKNRIAEQ